MHLIVTTHSDALVGGSPESPTEWLLASDLARQQSCLESTPINLRVGSKIIA